MNTLTEKYLKDIDARQEMISFVKRNKLIGFPLKDINKISGDFEYYIGFLKHVPSLEYDSNGNVVEKNTLWRDIISYEYDSNGNVVKTTFPNCDVFTHKYDSSGNKISEITPWGDIYFYEYDSNNNKIKVICPNGEVICWNYIYHDNGQLFRIEQNGKIILEIPKF